MFWFTATRFQSALCAGNLIQHFGFRRFVSDRTPSDSLDHLITFELNASLLKEGLVQRMYVMST